MELRVIAPSGATKKERAKLVEVLFLREPMPSGFEDVDRIKVRMRRQSVTRTRVLYNACGRCLCLVCSTLPSVVFPLAFSLELRRSRSPRMCGLGGTGFEIV